MPHSTCRAVGVSLRQLFPHARFIGGHDIVVRSCTSEWRGCREGDLFAAQLETDDDGHDFADQAIASGASALLVERLLPLRVPQCVVSDTRAAR